MHAHVRPPPKSANEHVALADGVAVVAQVDNAASGVAPGKRGVLLLTILLLLTLLLIGAGAGVGSTGLEPVWGSWHDPVAQKIIWEIRLPRTVGAWAAGALLGLAGAMAQGLFRNPLADPYLLGSASGASLGVATGLSLLGGGALSGSLTGALTSALRGSALLSGQWVVRLGLTGAAFVGAVLAVMLTLTLARGVQHTLRLLLAGVVVGVVFGALTSLILLFSPESMQAMQAFMLGTTSFVGWDACGLMLAVWLVTVLLAMALSRVLDGLALGEATARSLGLALTPLRAALVALLALTTATAVAQTGLVAFVGLAAPHLVRSVVKLPYRQLLPLASVTGGVLLAASDLLARGLFSPQELPVGVLTAVLGGSYLLWLMYRRNDAGALL